jgi:hypothetical protein
MEPPNSTQPGLIATSKILVAALMMGLLTMTGVMVVLVMQGMYQPQPGLEILLIVLTVLWPTTAGMSFVMKGVMAKQARAKWDASGGGEEEDLMPSYQATTIIRAALLEGPGLFGAITYLLTGNALALIAPALSLAGLGLIFPSEDKFRDFARSVTGRI